MIDLDNIHNKLSSDYSLNMCFFAIFPILMVNHFLRAKPLQNVHFERSVTCRFIRKLCSHIDKNSGEKV